VRFVIELLGVIDEPALEELLGLPKLPKAKCLLSFVGTLLLIVAAMPTDGIQLVLETASLPMKVRSLAGVQEIFL